MCFPRHFSGTPLSERKHKFKGLKTILLPISLPRQTAGSQKKIIMNSADKISFSKNYSLKSITHFPSAICRPSAASCKTWRRLPKSGKHTNLKTPNRRRLRLLRTQKRTHDERIMQGNPQKARPNDTSSHYNPQDMCEFAALSDSWDL